MAKRTYRRIEGWASFKYFDRINRIYWKNRYLKRTGAANARGWNYSPEYGGYKQAQRARIIKFAQESPEQFFAKADTVLRYSKLSYNNSFSYRQKGEKVQSYLNPHTKKWGVSNLMEQLKTRGLLAGKSSILIVKVSGPAELMPNGPEIVKTLTESNLLRDRTMINYRKNVVDPWKAKIKAMKEAAKKAGKKFKMPDQENYGLIAVNYRVREFTTGFHALGLVDVEMTLY